MATSISWRERLIEQPALSAFETWPSIPLESVPANRRRAFLRNQQVVAHALSGVQQAVLAERFRLSQSAISQLLTRSLGGVRESAPALMAGLVPYQTLQPRVRQQPLARLDQLRGSSCAFQQLLTEVPGLQQALDDTIESKLKDQSTAQRLTPQAFHGVFKQLLADAHWPTHLYPFTHVSQAYESVRRYLQQGIAAWWQRKQNKPPASTRQVGVRPVIHRALRTIQIDEHTLDLKGRVHLKLDDSLIPLRLARAYVLVATDVDTQCILGYYLTPSSTPNQLDLLALIDHCITPWQPPTLQTPGLSYTPGACFPSGLANGFPISFGTVQMDNAWMHRAHSVLEVLCQRMGATLNLGLPANPKVRQLVESVFHFIEQALGHRVASTTGSHPHDPIRESRKNQKRLPTISYQTLDEALSVILTEYNITPRAALGQASPLALFEAHCQHHYVRFVPAQLRQTWRPLLGSDLVTLHWYRHENRTPHVYFCFARYQGPGLLQAARQQQKVRVEFDRRDIRTLHAFTLAGQDLGLLQVQSTWRRFPHTAATRQWIHKNTRQYHFNMRDPLASYFRWHLTHRGKPAMALSLLQVYTEFTHGQQQGLTLGDPEPSTGPHQPHPANPTSWHPNMANHRR